MEDLKIFDLETTIMDEPSPDDFIHEEVYEEGFGGSSNLTEVRNRRTSVQNQNAQKETYYACPIFGLTHAINELNAMEGERIGEVRTELNALENTRAIVAAKEVWFRPTMGGTMQGAMNYAKKRGWIDGYTLVRQVGNGNGDKMRKALDDRFILYSGSGNINWRETCVSPGFVCIPGKAYNHIISITGYHYE